MGERALAVAVVMVTGLACGDDAGVVEQGTAPRIEVSEGGRPLIDKATLIVGASGQVRLTIANTGDGDLVVRAIALSETVPGAYTLSSNPLPSASAALTIPPGGAPHEIAVNLRADVVGAPERPRATVTIQTNMTIDGIDSFTVHLTPETVVARLLLQPTVLDFGAVEAGTSVTKPLNLLNTGAAPLAITRVALTAPAGYRADLGRLGGGEVRSEGPADLTLASPITLAPGHAQQVDVTFTADGGGSARGELIFYSDDPGVGVGGARASLYANLVGPCVRAVPNRVDFGAKLVGQRAEAVVELESCGDRDLEVSAITLGGGDDGFALELSGLSLPLVLAPGARAQVPVSYVPDALAARGADGQFIRDSNVLRVMSNAYLEGALEVPLLGFGTDGSCPVAIIEIAEGDEVVAQTELHLASASSSVGGEITRWQWSVVQPAGSVSSFYPSAEVSAPRFKPNVVGTYIFRLEVWDGAGRASCAPAEYVVHVSSDDALHVELLWRTPGDINESDEGGGANFSWGSDVDLHFLHPLAEGRFFDERYDCYWLTPRLDWGPAGLDGDPSLDRDDRDGGGPENLNVKNPEHGASYRVGVHYFNDWGYGNAFATVRVYVHGALRDQWNDVEITNAALWESHVIEWPSGRITRVTDEGGAPKITRGYPIP